MAVMKVKQFVDTALNIEKQPTVYYSVSGGDWCKWNGKSWNMDCVCMIKGILWGFNFNKQASHGGAIYLSNGVKDDTANGILKRCYDVSTDFSHIEYGELMHMNGHVGIYIGNGQVVEATAAWDYKVQISNVGKDGCRSKNGIVKGYWKEHGKLQYVDYTPTGNINVKELQHVLNVQYGCKLAEDGIFGPLTSEACRKNYLYKGKKASTHIKWLQTRLVHYGYSVGRYGIDGIFGNDTLIAVRNFQRDKHDEGLVVDGYVGKDTSKKLVE